MCLAAAYSSKEKKSVLYLYDSTFSLLDRMEIKGQGSQLHTLKSFTIDNFDLLLVIPLAHPYTFTIFSLKKGKIQKVSSLQKKGGQASVKQGGKTRKIEKENYGSIAIGEKTLLTFGENFNIHRLEVSLLVEPNKPKGFMAKLGCALI